MIEKTEYDGRNFWKNKKGYYRAGTKSLDEQYLHRYIWFENYGKIPDNCIVHHKDHNKENNTINNLELLDKREHDEVHAAEKRGVPRSCEVRKALSVAHAGKKLSQAHKNNISKGLKKRWHI